MKPVTYKSSGVDIAKANVFVRGIGPFVKSTLTDKVLNRHSCFGSLFSLAGKKYQDPVLASSTDGVGTKLLLAKLVDKHDTVGIDLVAMNVNDVLCTGARPLFFLDYIACGKVRPGVLKNVVKGIAEGCRQSGCSLVGGETAEMPGLYAVDEYDLAGFAVGIVEKKEIVDGGRIRKGDCIVGIASSGLHSNGFSLVRKVFSLAEQKKRALELLTPTRIYVKPVLALLERFAIKGIAHITGGAFYEKLTKILPSGTCMAVERTSWPVPDIFTEIQSRGNISQKEMFTTFNMGVGLALIVGPQEASAVIKALRAFDLSSWEIGRIIGHKTKRILL